jgi:hypothetical protein
MGSPGRSCVGAGILLLFTGCQAAQVAHDGKNVRQALLDIYTDQVMDNLIRAKSHEAFVQLAYRDLLVQDLDSFQGNVSDVGLSQQLKNKGPTGLLTSAARTVTNTLTVGATAKRDKTMSFHADPITDKNDIYELYLAFALSPELFCVS